MTGPVRISHYPRRDGPLPEGARYVGRPSRWGNPYPVRRCKHGSRLCWTVLSAPNVYGYREETLRHFDDQAKAHKYAVARYQSWLGSARPTVDAAHARNTIADLRDATALACDCPLHLPCHVDVLIELLHEQEAATNA